MTGRRRRRRKGKAVSGRLLHAIKASHPFFARVWMNHESHSRGGGTFDETTTLAKVLWALNRSDRRLSSRLKMSLCRSLPLTEVNVLRKTTGACRFKFSRMT